MTGPAAAKRPVARSGLILLGGQSTRMGRPKALIDFAGEPLLRRVARRVASVSDELVLVAAPKDHQPPGLAELLAALSCELSAGVVYDRAAHLGPVAGLAVGLASTSAPLAFVAGCDMPFLEPRLIEWLFARAGEASLDAVVPERGGHLEPLCAVYRVATVLPLMERQLAERELKPSARFGSLRARIVSADELDLVDPEGASFLNLNSPDDYRLALARLAQTAGAVSKT